MIDRATVEKIMEAANIVDVVSEFVTLRKSGANFKINLLNINLGITIHV